MAVSTSERLLDSWRTLVKPKTGTTILAMQSKASFGLDHDFGDTLAVILGVAHLADKDMERKGSLIKQAQENLSSRHTAEATKELATSTNADTQVEARLKKLEMQIKILLRGQSDVSLEAVIPEKIYFIREDTRQRSRIALIVILQSMVSIAAICSLTGP